MPRSIKTVPEMVTDLEADKAKNGYIRKIYKEQADQHRAEQLRQSIAISTDQLREVTARGVVNLDNLEVVKRRTLDYLTACELSATFPSVLGLAVYGFGMSNRNLNKYMSSHNNESTEFLEMVKDLIADQMAGASLNNNANPVMSIFILKNSHGFSDKVEIEPVRKDPLGDRVSAEELQRKYIEAYSDDYDLD